MTDWEKTFTNNTSNKGLLFLIYNELLKVNKEKQPDFKNRPNTLREIPHHRRYRGGK